MLSDDIRGKKSNLSIIFLLICTYFSWSSNPPNETLWMQALNRSVNSALLIRCQFSFCPSPRSFSSSRKGDDEWNDAWESAWLPEDLSASKNRAPWETDVHFPSPESPSIVLPSEADAETKAFVEDMTENWNDRRRSSKNQAQQPEKQEQSVNSLYSVENMKKDYRMKKQRIHAGLWMKEIEKQEEAKLNDSVAGDDIDKLLDTCSEYVFPFFS